MVAWKSKSCPRCGGDLFLDRDIYSWYEECVQCGYVHDLKNIDEFNQLMSEAKQEAAVAGKGRNEKAPPPQSN